MEKIGKQNFGKDKKDKLRGSKEDDGKQGRKDVVKQSIGNMIWNAIVCQKRGIKTGVVREGRD